MSENAWPVGEYMDAATYTLISEAIANLEAVGLKAIRNLTERIAELTRENVALAAQLETARWERDTSGIHNQRHGW